MNLIAQLNSEVIELGRGFDFETAYDFILEQDNDGEFYPGYDLILIDDNLDAYILEADCWAPVE